MEKSCKNCKFWSKPRFDGHEGRCQLHPPKVMQAGDAESGFYAKTCWAMTSPIDRCWHFEAPGSGDIRPWRHISEINVDFGK